MFTLNAEHLGRLLAINCFPGPRPEHTLFFFGLRGCLPVDPDDQRFAASHDLAVMDVNHQTPRCTLVQWRPATRDLSVYPGSTVPNQSYVQQALAAGGAGANMLMTGFYADYRKGVHHAGSPTAHDAFRQTEARPIRRSSDDLDFDNDDPADLENPCDNLHAAWCMGPNQGAFSSAGCQVVVGYPHCEKRGDAPDAGAWRAFKANAYSIPQDSFPYVLVHGLDAQRISLAGGRQVPCRLRYGSQGPAVEQLQQALKRSGYYEGRCDADFGPRTLRAVLRYQTVAFGPQSDDGIVGPTTASALRLELPLV
jgi:hypothetical protein